MNDYWQGFLVVSALFFGMLFGVLFARQIVRARYKDRHPGFSFRRERALGWRTWLFRIVGVYALGLIGWVYWGFLQDLPAAWREHYQSVEGMVNHLEHQPKSGQDSVTIGSLSLMYDPDDISLGYGARYRIEYLPHTEIAIRATQLP
jgi:hypothetical protein